jgi:hypothetical protein
MEAVIDLKFSINGNKVLVPVNWHDLTEVFEYGQNSNQPSIDSESFTFQGDSAELILKHFHPKGMLQPGNILVPLTVNIEYTQHGNTQRLIDDYVIDTPKGVQLNDAWFNNEFKPKEVVCSIRKKNGSDYFLTEIQGLTWGLLLDQGNVTSSDYTTVKTIVSPMYNFVDIVTALLTIYSLQKQFIDTVDAIKKSVADTTQRIGASSAAGITSPLSLVVSILFVVTKALLEVAAAIALLALSVKISLDLMLLLLPPVLKNKGITLRRGMEVICNRLGYEFSSSIKLLDQVVSMPSGAHSEGRSLIKDNLPNWFANPRGVPNDYDSGYVCVEYIENIKQLVNGRIDVEENASGKPTVFLRTEGDKSLFKKGGYKHRINPNYSNIEYNLPDIPHTRLISFEVDQSELYTIEHQEGRMWEVKNVSNKGNLPFTSGDYIENKYSLGYRKKNLSIIEIIITELAGVADKVASLLGQNTKLEEKIKGDRLGKLVVSQNNFSNPKFVVVSGGNIPINYLDVLSAKAIEEKFYVNRSIVRGTGQKLLLVGLEVPMSLADRDEIKKNGNFIDDYWGNSTFKKVEYQFSKDTAICDIEVDNDYIAKNTFKELTYNGLE